MPTPNRQAEHKLRDDVERDGNEHQHRDAGDGGDTQSGEVRGQIRNGRAARQKNRSPRDDEQAGEGGNERHKFEPGNEAARDEADGCAHGNAGKHAERDIARGRHDGGGGNARCADRASDREVDAAGEDHDRRPDCGDRHHCRLAEDIHDVGRQQDAWFDDAEPDDEQDQHGEHGQLL